MVLDLIKRSRMQILSASALSVMAGTANIWPLALIGRDPGWGAGSFRSCRTRCPPPSMTPSLFPQAFA